MRFRGLIAALAVFLAVAILGAGAALADPGGTWLTRGGNAKVHITSCGPGLCGTIVWQKKPGTDRRNPDPAKRDRAVIGIQMLAGMKPAGPNTWSGRVYNPSNGKTYDGTITLQGNTLKLSGCGGLFCGGETWTRSN